ncbi:hypothetical protein KP509_1Z173400 [Ceratopteris richardii]|nr:hypothetical protein KP509_1Z173400 [Ceratopteris richardii]
MLRRVTLVSEEGFEFVMPPDAVTFLLRAIQGADEEDEQEAEDHEKETERIRFSQLSCGTVEQLCRLLSMAHLCRCDRHNDQHHHHLIRLP